MEVHFVKRKLLLEVQIFIRPISAGMLAAIPNSNPIVGVMLFIVFKEKCFKKCEVICLQAMKAHWECE